MPAKGQKLTEKVCPRCEVLKPRSAFGEQKNGALRWLCKPCTREHRAEERRTDPERIKEYKRRHNLKRQFGISIEDYESLLQAQDGRCGICGKKPKGRRLAVDHNHETGEVRGLLCAQCNRGLGQIGDSAEAILRATAYLGISSTEIKQVLSENERGVLDSG